MSAPVFFKDPDATVDFPIDFTDYLDGDTISGTPDWDVPSGLSLQSQTNTTTSATAFLSGGVAGVDYLVRCRIATAAGRTDDRALIIRCRDL